MNEKKTAGGKWHESKNNLMIISVDRINNIVIWSNEQTNEWDEIINICAHITRVYAGAVEKVT